MQSSAHIRNYHQHYITSVTHNERIVNIRPLEIKLEHSNHVALKHFPGRTTAWESVVWKAFLRDRCVGPHITLNLTNCSKSVKIDS